MKGRKRFRKPRSTCKLCKYPKNAETTKLRSNMDSGIAQPRIGRTIETTETKTREKARNRAADYTPQYYHQNQRSQMHVLVFLVRAQGAHEGVSGDSAVLRCVT